jgi:hypothetical protein
MARIVIVVLLTLAALALWAQLPASDRAAVEDYRSAIAAISARATPRGVETAFSKLMALSESLTRPRTGQLSVLESLSEEDFRRLTAEIPGAWINREETVFIAPDPAYFVNLARSRGEAADRSFFAALKATYPESVWPVYIEQQTDYSGCTSFGGGRLVAMYRQWSRFQSTFPTRYVVPVRERLEDISSQLTDSTCACGDASSVEKELRQFLQSFPTSPLRPRITERLQALRNGRSEIRAHCLSG